MIIPKPSSSNARTLDDHGKQIIAAPNWFATIQIFAQSAKGKLRVQGEQHTAKRA
jgi:hypothetical protein